MFTMFLKKLEWYETIAIVIIAIIIDLFESIAEFFRNEK